MPFTFAHPAIVIPLKRNKTERFDVTALVLGSMAPDFEYFIRFKAHGVWGHTFIGFIFLNLPLVLVSALLWNYVIKKSFIYSLPKRMQPYFTLFLYKRWEIRSIKAFVNFVISAIIGMFSHVLWDSFTHADSFFVNRIPFLSECIDIFGMKIAIYKILQHGSTLIGFGIIFIYLYLMSRNKKGSIPKVCVIKKIGYWVSILLAALIIVIYRAFFTLDTLSFAYYGIYIVSLISGLIIGIVSVSCCFEILKIYD